MMNQEMIGLLASLIGLYAFLPYLRDIFRGKTRPHVFSWGIWASLPAIVFAAQITEGGGAGAWVTGLFAICNFTIFILAFKYGEKVIARGDWIMLAGASLAIPLWLLTDNPLWSVMLICLIDILAFGPTFGKSWHKPHEETLQTYIMCAISFFLSVFALETLNLSTILYPATLVGTNVAFVIMVFWQRRAAPVKKD
ncbi:MAG: hypothetical protein ACXW30_05195 [Micavibrio sp.]